jgi:hypothetical protein
MKKILLFFALLSLAFYKTESKDPKNLETLIEEAINADKPLPSTGPLSIASLTKENNTLATKSKRVIKEYQKLKKQDTAGKQLSLRYQYTHALIEIASYSQALLDLIEQYFGKNNDEKLTITRDSLEIRRVKLANKYDLFNKKPNLTKQEIAESLKNIDTLFNDTKAH